MTLEESEIRVLIRYCYKRGLSTRCAVKEICDTEGEGTVSQSKASRWYRRFGSGDFTLEDQPRSGRPSTLDSKDVVAALEAEPSSSSRDLATALGVSSHQTILNRLNQMEFVHKRPRLDPHWLTRAQSARRVEICQQLLSNPLDDRFWKRIITSDEKWVYLVNHNRQKKWVQRDEQPPSVPKPNQFDKKAMICVWWNFQGLQHFELLPQGRSINAELYCQQLDRVYEKLKQKYPAMINRGKALFQQDNARPHTARLTKGKFEQMDGVEILPHPPYSPDAAPSDYGLFRSMTHFLRGRQFVNFDEVEEACLQYFHSKPEDWYMGQIRMLADRWQKIVDNDGLYFDE